MDMIMNKIITIFVIIALIPVVVAAQQTVSLTVEKSIEIGIANSKSLHSSRMRFDAADAKSSEVSVTRFPTVKFSGGYSRLSDIPPFDIGPYPPLLTTPITISSAVLDNYNTRLTFQQPIFTGFRLQSETDLADYTAQATGKDYSRDKSNLVYNIKNAYWTLYKAKEFKRVVDEVVDQMKSHLRDVQNIFGQGIATKNDVLRVETQLSNAELTQLDAGNNVQLATIGLNNIIGLPLLTNVDIASQIQSTQSPSYDVNDLIRQANERRPDLRAIELRVKAGEAGVGMARSGWFPQIYLVGNYYYARPNQRIFPTIDAFKSTWDVSLNVSMDIWNWGTTIHQTNQAQAELAQAQDALGQLKDGISLDVTQSYLNFNESRDRIEVAQKGVEQAEENYRITNEKFKSGLALNSDVLDAEVSLLQAKWNYIQALVDHELADARLQQATALDMNY
jgi:outer membrane protein